MKILIVGAGGREHAIGWKIKQDRGNNVSLYFAPGNAGTQELGENLAFTDKENLLNFAKEEAIQLTIIGPEALLVEGIVDDFEKEGLAIFGPNKKAAQLEGSKVFAKQFMQKYGVKTAQYHSFENVKDALKHIDQITYPTVVKADGLAAGKGVLICENKQEATAAVTKIMQDRQFGEAGSKIVVEQFIQGFEVSVLAVFNGETITPFISAKDHKKIGEGETGPNTGGMGVVAPNPLFGKEYEKKFHSDILEPTLHGLKREKLDFSGVIFFGLMVNDDGVYLLEYNLRMGDPETQAILPLLNSDFVSVIEAALNKKQIDVEWQKQNCCCVVLASEGYPESYKKGEVIAIKDRDALVFHAGVKRQDEKYVTNGGRVMAVVGKGDSLEKAKEQAYSNLENVSFNGMYFRKDIGQV